MRRGRSWLLRSAVLFLVAATFTADARSEDAAPAESLETRLYPVRALTRGVRPWPMDACPLRSQPGISGEHPVFAGYWEDWRLPLGDVVELLDRLRASVGPESPWDDEGVVAEVVGNGFLLIRATPATHESVASYLAAQARWIATCLDVDVVALSGDPASVQQAGGVSTALASRAVRVLGIAAASVRAVPSRLQIGSQRAYLADVDTEVAQSSGTTDPIVGVLADGLACQVAGAPTTPGRVRLDVRGWWAAPPALTPYATKGGDVLEMSSQDGCSFQRTVDAADGEWSVVLVGGGVSLAIRAGVVRPAIDAEDAAGVLLVGPSSPVEVGPVLERRWDVSDLDVLLEHSRGTDLYVPQSNYVLPEPPELPEGGPRVPFDATWMPVVLDPETWSVEGVGWRRSGSILTVTHDADRLGKIARMLDALRAWSVRSTRLTISVLAVPPSVLPAFRTDGDVDTSSDVVASILGCPGGRRLGTGSLLLHDNQRVGRFDGAHHVYLSDFDVAIAEASAIANPTVRQLFDGTSLDVTAFPILGSNQVLVDARIARGTLREMRHATSVHGRIDCPVYERLFCGGTIVVPVGGTRLLGAGMVGSEALVVLVTATRE
jgi:hypothetical protein